MAVKKQAPKKKVVVRKTTKPSIGKKQIKVTKTNVPPLKNEKTILEFKNITKTFLGGHIIANDNISLSIKENEIHSLIGENGSGKSTLTSVLFGLYKQDSGEIHLDGKLVNMYEPGAAKKHAIGMVHQHFHLVNEFTVLQNILVGQEKTVTKFFGIIDKQKALARFNEIANKYHIKLDPEKLVRRLTVGERQKVEIFKVLWQEKKIIIFDEPTATLSVDEIVNLMNTIRQLKNEGKTIIFISHKMKEVKEISDTISVLRKGKLISTTLNTAKLTPQQIATQMIGELVKFNYKKFKPSDENLLEVEGISFVTKRGFKALEETSFTIKKGEIFGLAGIQGNGQEEVFDIVAGLKKPETGVLKYKGTDITHKPIVNRLEFISHIPIDRIKHGVILDGDLRFNSILSIYKWKGLTAENSLGDDDTFLKRIIKNTNSALRLIDNQKVEKFTNEIITNMNVEGARSLSIPIRNLSGGNQQKFVVGRELNRPFDLLIAGHPTRGLDVKAIDHIYKTFIKTLDHNRDKAILLYSLELSELMAVCDRLAIMYKGKIVDIIDPKHVSIDKISKMMVGEK